MASLAFCWLLRHSALAHDNRCGNASTPLRCKERVDGMSSLQTDIGLHLVLLRSTSLYFKLQPD